MTGAKLRKRIGPRGRVGETAILVGSEIALRQMLTTFAVLLGVTLAGLAAAQEAAPVLPKFPDVKLMVVVPERVDDVNAEEATAETEIIRVFLAANYKVVDQQQYASQRYTPVMDAVLRDPTGPEARSLTANFGADVLLVGQAFARDAGGAGGGLASYRANVTLRAVSTRGDAQVLGATDQTGSGADAADEVAGKIALRKAANAAAVDLLQSLGNAVGGPTRSSAAAAGSTPSGKPRIGVMRFKDQSQWSMANWDLGMQIPHLISLELQKTRRYQVVELNNIDDVKAQQRDMLGGTYEGAAGRDSEAGTLVRPDYVVVGRITEFSTKKKGGLVGGLFGAAAGLGAEEAIVRMLIEIVDVKTGVVLASSEAGANATEAVIGGGYVGIIFGGAQFDRSAAGRATRKAIAAAVKIVNDNMPVDPNAPPTCPKCGKACSPEAKFCPECGAKLEVAPATCPKCHQPVKKGAKFCEECGAALNGK